MCIGEAILRLRRERNLSQADLAELLDVSRQSVSRLETGGAVLELDKPVRTPPPRRFFADANKHPAGLYSLVLRVGRTGPQPWEGGAAPSLHGQRLSR